MLSLYLICYNEEYLIEHTINHYLSRFKNIKITILDNYSTDNSLLIANNYGCNIIQFNTNNELNEFVLLDLRNNIWKNNENDWIIICDMDEWLCITEDQLLEEDKRGTTIIKIKGFNIIGNSDKENLSDINLHELNNGVRNKWEDKNICFNKKYISNMNFAHGCHSCNPIGNIQYSEKEYILKHMDLLGINYLLYKYKSRFLRSINCRNNFGHAKHYTDNNNKIIKRYEDESKLAIDIRLLI